MRPGLVGAHQFVGDPVGVLEAQPQIGVVVPQVVGIGLEPPARRGEVESGLGWRERHGALPKASAASTEAARGQSAAPRAARLDFNPASDDAKPYERTRPAPELSARALIARVARVYLAPRWKGWITALARAPSSVAFLTTELVQILEPATNDLLVTHKPGQLVRLPLTIAAFALGAASAQVIQATLVNRIGNGVVGDVQVQLFGRWCAPTWRACAASTPAPMSPRCSTTPA